MVCASAEERSLSSAFRAWAPAWSRRPACRASPAAPASDSARVRRSSSLPWRTWYSGATWIYSPRSGSALTKVRREQPASGPPSRVASTRLATTWRMAIASGRRIPGCPRAGMKLAGFERTPELCLAPGPVHHLALELAACRIDVVTAGPAHGRNHAGVVELLLERADRVLVRALVARARERIE